MDVRLCGACDPDAPCVRLRLFGEIRQAFESPGYGTLYVTANARQTTCPTNTVYIQLCLESAQYGRMCQAWPLPYDGGAEYTAQYDHLRLSGRRVFEWLETLVTWLFSGAWKGGGGEMR